MKSIVFVCALALSSTALAKDTFVKGYQKKDGTYVQPHFRSGADNNPYNNYSTKGNENPYTGKQGTVDPYGTNSNPYNYNTNPYGN